MVFELKIELDFELDFELVFELKIEFDSEINKWTFENKFTRGEEEDKQRPNKRKQANQMAIMLRAPLLLFWFSRERGVHCY